MGSKWKTYRVEEFAEVVGGGTPRTKIEEYWNGEIPWITPQDLSDYKSRYISYGERFISKEGLENSSAKMVPAGTVLLSSRAPVGYLAIAKNPLCTNQGFRSLIVKEGFSPEFIYYLLKNNVEYLQRNASGTTFQELSGGTLKTLEFNIPDYKTQCEIAGKLGAFDDKIELNQRMNETLEAIARAIFKSWFVDFDPVKAKMSGEPYPLPDAIMALFPDELVESELGMIPKGWEVGKLGDEFKVVMGQSPPGSSYNEEGKGIAFYQGRTDFGFRYPSERVYCTEPKRFAEPGDTLVSVRAPVGDVNMAKEKCCIGRGVAAIRHKSGNSSYTFYSMLDLQCRFKVFEAEGTVFGSIGKKDLGRLKVIKPPNEYCQEFEDTVSPLDKKIENNSQQINLLHNMRDALLQKLMSGEIKI